MNPLVSIIVPVYNTVHYIRRCVDSILCQDYRNLEILLVDDGSTDGSGELLDEYARMDGRICVIHQENAGVSVSRNRALDLARGEYVQFVDSDDWLAENATSLFVAAALEHGCDMVIADFFRVSGERTLRKGDITEELVMDRVGYAAHMMRNSANVYYGVLWNKFYRRSIIEAHGLRMDGEISWCEDFLFNLEYIRYAETFYSLCQPVYYYFYRKNSLISQCASIRACVKMKIDVFRDYKAFYKDVYGADYGDVKVKVHYFLISHSKDFLVLPDLLKKNKAER